MASTRLIGSSQMHPVLGPGSQVIERQQLVKVEGDLGCAVGQRTVRADAVVESIPGYDLTLPLREAAR